MHPDRRRLRRTGRRPRGGCRCNGKTKKALDVAEVKNRAIAVEAEALQKAAVRRGVVQKAAQPNRAPLIQQFTQQARPLLRAEIIFARNVCHLNRDELRKVNADAQKMLDEVIEKLVEAQAQPRVRWAAARWLA